MSNTETSNAIATDTKQRRMEIENKVQEFQRLILVQDHKIHDLETARERELDAIFQDLLAVIDAYDKADARLAEQYVDNEDVTKARKRFATSKKKLVEILKKNGVEEIQFPDGVATLKDCQIVETEPDSSKENDTIVSVEKAGFRRNGRLLRLADVIVVKN